MFNEVGVDRFEAGIVDRIVLQIFRRSFCSFSILAEKCNFIERDFTFKMLEYRLKKFFFLLLHLWIKNEI